MERKYGAARDAAHRRRVVVFSFMSEIVLSHGAVPGHWENCRTSLARVTLRWRNDSQNLLIFMV